MAADTKIVDVSTEEMILVNLLPSGKAFVAPYAFSDLASDGFTVLGGAPWFASRMLR